MRARPACALPSRARTSRSRHFPIEQLAYSIVEACGAGHR